MAAAGRGCAVNASRRLRVLVVSLGRRGGINDYGWHMAKALSSRCDVATVTSADADNRERWSTLGTPFLEVPTFSDVKSLLLSFLRFDRFARIRRFAREFAPDVIYYPGGHAWKPMLDLVLPRSAKVVLTVHDPELHPGEDTIAHRILDASNRLRVDGYVLLNSFQKDGFVRRVGLPAEKVAVLPHGVFDDLVDARRPLDEIPGLEAVSGLGADYALFVGRIQRYKGIDILLEAYASLSADTALPLVIAGEGEFSAEESALLSGLSARQVVVVNRWLSDTELASLVASARFVVLPYTTATQSGVIPLASSFGIPSIASDAGGIAEQVVDGESGLLFPSGDALTLAAVLERAFAMDDASYALVAEGARRYAATHWSWDAIAEGLVAFLDGAMDARS